MRIRISQLASDPPSLEGQHVVAVDVLVVVRPSDVRECRIDFKLHLGAVSRLAVVLDGDSDDGLFAVSNLEFSGLLVAPGYLDKSLKCESRNYETCYV